MDLTETEHVVPGPDEEPPDFSEWDDPESVLRDHPVRERLLDVLVGTRTPTKVSAFAERANCDTGTAREYLKWFAEMGMANRLSGRPVRYERNESYLRWRRVERIREAYTEEELVAEIERGLEERTAYRERFDATAPEDISLVAASDDRSVETVWEALSEWKTLERRLALLDDARRDGSHFDGIARVDA